MVSQTCSQKLITQEFKKFQKVPRKFQEKLEFNEFVDSQSENKNIYGISSNKHPQRLINFKTVRCGAN